MAYPPKPCRGLCRMDSAARAPGFVCPKKPPQNLGIHALLLDRVTKSVEFLIVSYPPPANHPLDGLGKASLHLRQCWQTVLRKLAIAFRHIGRRPVTYKLNDIPYRHG